MYVTVARGKKQRNPVMVETTCHELKHSGRRLIEPLGVVYQAEHGRFGSEHVCLVLDLLHHHHTGEDTGLWPLVRARAPDLGAQLDMMEAEHALVARAIISSRAAARQYAAATTNSSGADHRLHAVLTELGRVLLPHLDHEETEVMPRVMRALTPGDWSLLSRREFRNWNSLTLAGTGLVWMADGLEHTERVKFNQQLSTVVRWLVDKRYGVAYRRRTAVAFGIT